MVTFCKDDGWHGNFMHKLDCREQGREMEIVYASPKEYGKVKNRYQVKQKKRWSNFGEDILWMSTYVSWRWWDKSDREFNKTEETNDGPRSQKRWNLELRDNAGRSRDLSYSGTEDYKYSWSIRE